ncbi:non-oxidative hydroxyarylic acid decarboxylases subunit D [Effusibacillus dendaii]|uniref:non-oxidative hydroxyarylic acid decarboxylases subunit D n=1 Tax=Effusibacillus dendaii TaxID=2743772 RepID=UPI00190D9D37|nr:non-oxidative hydroxyarylic acid decarboxylases subunit D [Effusibacillus dendaii]
MNSCPRCENSNTRMEHRGKKGNRVIWTVYCCNDCSFSWRDSEPQETINPQKRDPFFQVDLDRFDKYPVVLPPGLI